MDDKRITRTAYKNQFASAQYDRISLFVPKGNKEVIRQHADSQGKSINKYINDLIDSDMKKAGLD